MLPRIGKYRIRQKTLILDNGAVVHSLRKVPLSELEEWDACHDAVGHTIEQHMNQHHVRNTKGADISVEKALDH